MYITSVGTVISLSGMNLLATLPDTGSRCGYMVQNQSTNQLVVAFDNTSQPSSTGAITPMVILLAPATTNNTPGGLINWLGFPHKGRIQIYGPAGSQFAAGQV